MKILFLATSVKKGSGGIQKISHDFFQVLNQLGYNQRLITIDNNSTQHRFFRKLVFIVNAFRIILSFDPDLIFCGHINFSFLCLLFKKIFRKKYVLIVYGIEVWNLSSLGRIGLKNAEALISISEYTKKKIYNQISRFNIPIFIIPPAINTKIFKLTPKPKKLLEKYNLEDNKIILTVARLSSGEKYKGYDKIIKALAIVLKEVPGTKYLLVGRGDDLPRIERLIKKLGLEKAVVLCGFILHEKLIDYYNLCDVFVMPSKGEGFGIVYLEALACGKPVIAGNQDASKEPLLHGELGLLVDPDNVEEIAEAIIKVLSKRVDPKLLDGQYLRRRVVEVYGLERFRERVRELMENLSQR